jgi:hypothetical protein
VLRISREHDRVVAVGRRQRQQARSVEVDAVVADEIRILARVHAARGEINRPGIFVDLHDVADDPFPLGDLLLHGPGRAVIQVEVIPAVPL